MALYDIYEPYRTPLTYDEQDFVEEARLDRAALDGEALTNPDVTKVPGGYQHKTEGFIVDPVVKKHMQVAMRRAEEQFHGWPAMPEDADISLRYPGVDPVGKYSVIDMKIAQRVARIKASLESRSPEGRFYADALLEAAPTHPKMSALEIELAEVSKRHRILTRASKLCLDPEGRRMLHEESRALEVGSAVEQYDKYLQGVEYAAGIETGPVPQEVIDWYKTALGHSLDLRRIKEAETLYRVPREIHVEFQDLDNKLLQSRFANPHNWGKPQAALEKDAFALEEAAGIVPPYARATAERVITPLFQKAEALGGGDMPLNRGDLIIVDGKTVREKMYEDFMATGQDSKLFNKFYKKNLKQMTSEYVAAGLMAGKRVEAFIPDRDGRIQAEPVQITKTGYEPSPLKKVTLNAWERFFARRGFFKEKVAKAAEYERTLAARERVKAANVTAKLVLDGGAQTHVKDQFFGDWKRENGALPSGVPNGYSVDRSAFTTTTICALAAKGYAVADLFDPTKLQAEKQAMGWETIHRMQSGDQKWMGETLFHGQRLLMDYLDQAARTVNVLDEKQLFSEEARHLFAVSRTAFDASQEKSRCKAEYHAAAEVHAPGQGKAAAQEVDDRVNTSCMLFDFAAKSMEARTQFAGGIVSDVHNSLNHVANFEAAKRLYGQKMQANPEVPVTKQFTISTMGGFYGYTQMIRGDKNYQALIKSLKTPENQRAFGHGLLSGRVQERMHIEADMEHFKFGFRLDAPSKADVKQAEQGQTVQALDQKNAAKSMGGGRTK